MAIQEDVAALTPKILADGHEIRILVNCAGIQRRHPCEEFPDSDFNEVNQLPFSVLPTTFTLSGKYTIDTPAHTHPRSFK